MAQQAPALAAFAAVALLLPLPAAPPSKEGTLPAPVTVAMENISPNSMKGHISFLASDLLEGRNTPSRGLDIAAEYVAAQFRRAGLDPLPGGSYFQVAHWKYKTLPLDQLQMTFTLGQQRINVDGSRFSIQNTTVRTADNAPVFKAKLEDAAALKEMPEGNLEGKIVLLTAPTRGHLGSLPEEQQQERYRLLTEFGSAMTRLKPLAAIIVRAGERGGGVSGQLIDPKAERQRRGFQNPLPVAVFSHEVMAAFESLPAGETAAKVSLRIPEAVEQPVDLRNVIGILPGSDPVLKDTYVLVTGHYDHLGMTAPENGDGVYNGANDDASGTASVIEIASAMMSMKQRPKRTIIFMSVFGEEKGLLGTYYYSRNPVFPLEKTVADINLEHMGRTDSSEGPQVNRVSMTGYDYTSVPEYFTAAGRLTGVEVYKHAANSDAFYARSDNLAFAQAGIPSHTFCVAFLFADYHGLADHWEKIDYENLARVNRTVLAGLWMLAQSSDAPHWNEENPKTEPYRSARKGEGNKPIN